MEKEKKENKEKKVEIKEEKGKKKTWVVFLVIGIVLCYILFYGLMFLGIALDYNGGKLTTEGNYIMVDKDALKIDNVMTASIKNNSYVIEGYLTNTSSNMSNVDVVFNVYDINGILLGQAYDSVSNLKENTTWRFKASYDDFDYNNISSYELVEVNYY